MAIIASKSRHPECLLTPLGLGFQVLGPNEPQKGTAQEPVGRF